MEDNENEDTLTLAQLLLKRRKLMDLRKNVINNTENRKNEGPVETNHSQTDPGTSRLEIQHSICTHSIPMNNKTPPSSSPLRPMSPETQQLFNMLNEGGSILENREFSNHEDMVNDYDSDDSVRDPNFVIHDKVNIDDSTSCSSLDINECNEASIHILTTNEERHNILGPILSATPPTEVSTRPLPLLTEDEETNINYLRSNVGTGRPKKGRKRINPQLRSERKYNKYNNLEYTTTKNEKVKPKVFIDYQCPCSKNCASLISAGKRKEEFEKFVQLGSFNAQLLYIVSCVKEYNKKRSYTMTNIPAERKKPKQFSRVYSISGVPVCRDMFLKTFQITTQRVSTSLRKNRSGEPITDGRGVSRGGHTKMTDEDHKFIIDIINKFPKYESHYRRENNNGTLYLQTGMTLQKNYNIYQQEFAQHYGQERKCASFDAMKKIFYSNFNLRCKKVKKDTCNKCDMLAMKIQSAKSQEEKRNLERAEKLTSQMKQDFIEAQILPNVESLTFDLEKTLPLPRIATNVAFYKRQLWLYNSGVHSASDDVGHCFVWVEGDAGRGAQEVGSCLLKFIEMKLSSSVEHFILWSDCCGGQNRNIKIVLMLKAALSCHQSLKTITFRFLESGHTFLPNDTDFSKIETALKHHQSIYTAEEYLDIFKNCKKRKPLQVYRMEKNDFYSTVKIEKNITNRKKYIDKSKVNWLNTKEIKIEKDKMFSIFMRSTFDEDFMELQIDKKIKEENRHIKKTDLSLLWPNGKPIAPAKLTDLTYNQCMDYIPANCLQFYQNLKSSDDVIDDVDGFGGESDFDVQDDENNE